MGQLDMLTGQHQSLLEIVKKLTPLLSVEKLKTDAAQVRSGLSELAGTLKIHLKMEDEFFYPSLLKSEDALVNGTAKRFMSEMGSLVRVFTDYNDKWKAELIESQPENFLKETQEIVKALGNRIDREEKELYPLLSRAA